MSIMLALTKIFDLVKLFRNYNGDEKLLESSCRKLGRFLDWKNGEPCYTSMLLTLSFDTDVQRCFNYKLSCREINLPGTQQNVYRQLTVTSDM